MTGFGVLSTTVAEAAQAEDLARALIEARLAACVQIQAVRSLYRWNGDIECADEYLLLCKIVATDFEEVARFIRARHAYETPELVMMPIAQGSDDYLGWLKSAVSRR